MLENGAMCFKPQDPIFLNKLIRFLKNVETSKGLQKTSNQNNSKRPEDALAEKHHLLAG